MAEGLDSDERDRQKKTESILLWRRNVEIATQQGPHVPPDRGLISNPDLTSFSPDPTLVTPPPSAADQDPMQALSSSPPLHPPSSSHHPSLPVISTFNQSELLPHVQHNRALGSTRSASLSLSSKKPSVILSQLQSSRLSLRHKARDPPLGKSEKKSSPIHQHLPIATASAQSKNFESSPDDQNFAVKETVKYVEKSSEPRVANDPKERKDEAVSAMDDVMSGDEQRLRELRSLARTRQTSLSPLPAPTTLPALPPTFNLPDVRVLPTRHPWMKKKLPTIGGIRSGASSRVPPSYPSHTKLLSRATTSPGELSTPTLPKSAPSSPKPNRAVNSRATGEDNIGEGATSMQQDNRKRNEGEQLSCQLGTLERHKSFSHDDVGQLQQFERLDVGGVSPAASYGSINDNDDNDEGVPGSQQSLVAEGGSSEEERGGERSMELFSSLDKVEESVASDEAAVRSNSGGLPSSQSPSSVVSDRNGSDSVNQTAASHHHLHSATLLPVGQEDHKKVISSRPLSPLSLSSPGCTPHSPLMRQRHISRSPSPSLPHTPPTSPLHKSWMSGSHVGTESENVISKRKLELLDKCQTFSFDTSEDSDFTKLSKQPKFLQKKPLQSCPVSPPPLSLLSPPSSQRSPGGTQHLLHHHHHQYSPSSDGADPRSPTEIPSPTQLSSPSARSRNPSLSEQLLLRRGSTPVTQSQQGGAAAPFSAKFSSRLSSNRSSIPSVNPARPSIIRSPQAARKFTSPKSIEELKESRFKFSEGREIAKLAQTSNRRDGPSDKGPVVNRQDSGLGTLSTISNKFNL